MQTWTKTCTLSVIHPIVNEFLHIGDLFLDIETTGLSRTNHQIYLIGIAALVDHNIITVNQFFADQLTDEANLLSALLLFMQEHSIQRILTFNGNRFDLPFLTARANIHQIPISFASYERFDIYQEVRKRKNYLQLQSYRQKSLEQFLGICREDLYSGGDLIKVYLQYTKHPTPEAVHLLQLHNYEDLLGMPNLLAVFAYERLFSSTICNCIGEKNTYFELDGTDCEELLITCTLPFQLPGTISCQHPVSKTYIHAYDQTLRLRIPLCQHLARLYYSDYKNYYYIPSEGISIHKSVADIYDKSLREKATPENCYTTVEISDTFLHSAQLSEFASHVLRYFL